jgi:uncharacterized damage-inducible protein DinB
MPGQVPPIANERDGLIAYLAQQRLVLRLAAHGLTDEQARATPTVSSLSVGGLIKHVTGTEKSWMDRIRGVTDTGGEDDYMSGFTMGPDQSLAKILAGYQEVAERSDELLAEVDLDKQIPVPHDVPWFPKDVDAWSARWIVLHMIEETARHAGHADIVRESIDGATAFPLMAAAEGWPETPWMRPWRPAGAG